MESTPMPRRFWGLFWLHSLGVFNENGLRTLIAFLVLRPAFAHRSAEYIAAAAGIFILPFILFSTWGGDLADRRSKKEVILWTKGAEFAAVALAIAALKWENLGFCLALLALLAAASAVSNPVRLAVVPELVGDKHLSLANGLLQMGAFAGGVIAAALSGWLVSRLGGPIYPAAGLLALAGAGGLLASCFLPGSPPATRPPEAKAGTVLDDLIRMREYRGVYLATIGSAFFWFLAAIFQMNIFIYGKELLGLGERGLGYLQLAVGVGIAAGCWAAGWISRNKVELGLVPVGAVGLVIFCLELALAVDSPRVAALSLLLLGASGGFFIVPLQALIQQQSPPESRGRFIGIGNLLSFGAALVASGWLWVFKGSFQLDPAQIFLVVAAMTCVVAAYILWMLPDAFIRLLLFPVAHLIYRIRVHGLENIPLNGPALLISNHVSFIDALLIGGATQRMVRFLMLKRYYSIPGLQWFFRAMGCIPIAGGDKPKAILLSLREARRRLRMGEAVCIFAEGEITRHGQLLSFKKGYQRIVSGLKVPIIPIHLDRVWGSVFSFSDGRVLFKKPRRLPYPVTVSIGTPMPSDTPAAEVRKIVQGLSVSAFEERLAEWPTLPAAFVREAKRRPSRLAVIDGQDRLTYRQLLAKALALSAEIERRAPAGPVGLVMDSSCRAAAAQIAAGLAGRAVAGLHGPLDTALSRAKEAKAAVICTKAWLEKEGAAKPQDWILLEDLEQAASRRQWLWNLAAFLPGPLIARLARSPRSLGDAAAILWTSGSTAPPKGVVLSHRNILSSVEALAQLFQLKESDRVLAVLPLFHGLGYTLGLWFPLLSGTGVIYPAHPRNPRAVGEAAFAHRATVLAATPSLLEIFLRSVDPNSFRYLRFVIAGGERLRKDLARVFEERFGLIPLEGYGCTEVTSLAAVNIPDIDWPGVAQRGMKVGTIGHPVPGVVIEVVHPETKKPLPFNEIGLVTVRGPNVMLGYLNDEAETQRVVVDGAFITDDMASVDEDGFATFADRAGRWKGRLSSLEDKLHELAGVADQTFIAAATDDGIAVYHKPYGDLDWLVKKLAEAGLSGTELPSRSSFFRVESFPLLPSGQIDLRKLADEASRPA